jgi:hypothetical protein
MYVALLTSIFFLSYKNVYFSFSKWVLKMAYFKTAGEKVTFLTCKFCIRSASQMQNLLVKKVTLFILIKQSSILKFSLYRVTDEKPLTLYLTYSSSDLNK